MAKKCKCNSRVLKYATFDRVARWNYCQQLAKHLYYSETTDEHLAICAERCEFDKFKILINVKTPKHYEK